MDAGRASQGAYVVRGRAFRQLSVYTEKVKELRLNCEEWAEWELEVEDQVTGGKFGGRQQWDHRNLLDTGGEDKTVAWGLEVSGGSGPGSGARSLGELGCPGFVERLTCRPWFGVAQWGGCEEGSRRSWMLGWPLLGC